MENPWIYSQIMPQGRDDPFFQQLKISSLCHQKVTNHSERNTQPQSILMSESLSHSLYAYLSAWPRNIVITSQLGSLPPALPLLNTSSITTPVRASHCVSGHPTSLLQTFQQLTVHSIIQGTFLRVLYFRHHARVLVIQVGKKRQDCSSCGTHILRESE